MLFLLNREKGHFGCSRSGVRCHPHDTYSIELNGTEQSKVPAYCTSICCLNVSESIPFHPIGVTLNLQMLSISRLKRGCGGNGKSNIAAGISEGTHFATIIPYITLISYTNLFSQSQTKRLQKNKVKANWTCFLFILELFNKTQVSNIPFFSKSIQSRHLSFGVIYTLTYRT